MNYIINKINYHDFSVMEINKYPPRAYFIPYPSKEKHQKVDIARERYESDHVTVLNGEWDFKYFDKVSSMPEVIDTEKTDFDTIAVPSTWQRLGYEPPVYLNVRYEFGDMKSEYPSIPKDVSCGVYRKNIEIKDVSKEYIISFLGVISSLDLYINGKYVGYSEGAHNSAEFKITDYLHEGENELLAVVYKWSNATYLECQDMFRENGIFRDVLLTSYEKTFISDFDIKLKKIKNKYRMRTAVTFDGDCEGYDVEVELSKDGKVLKSEKVKADESHLRSTKVNRIYFEFNNLDVIEWNAEVPTLYDTYITLSKNGEVLQVIHNYTGFKTIEIIDGIFYFNGQPIKCKGVNHHDTNPVTGYYMTADDIIKDIKLMKELNVNTVRTSHYPPDPFLLMMCNYYGMYVCDEADIETHGAHELPGHINDISGDMKWAERYVDRVKRMYFRDRNHPSIIMWSLGNESGSYECHDACYGFLKAECPEIPVHYEGATTSERVAYDIATNMYAHVDDYYNGTGPEYVVDRPFSMTDKPYFLCEYCHAMGIGPGGLQEYWDAFYSNDRFMGGCIWEWADHAVTHYNKELKYTYGGDHGERRHDGNFCVDGLVYPDRTPHTGAWEMKAVYRPIIANRYKGNEVIFKNTNYFLNAEIYDVKWDLLKNGKVCESGELKLNIAPNSSKKIVINYDTGLSLCDEYHLIFTYYHDGFEVAKEQVALQEIYREIKLDDGEVILLESDDKTATVKVDNGAVVFNKVDGNVISMKLCKKELINKNPAGDYVGFVPNIWRAPHDNDTKFKNFALGSTFNKAEIIPHSFDINSKGNCVVAKTVYNIVSEGLKLFKATQTYSIFANGQISMGAKLEKLFDNEIENDIPRFGVSVEMPRGFENIEYFGLGERENLPDFKAHATLGIFNSKVADTHEPYVFPQENGYHGEVRWLKVTDNDGDGFMVCNGFNKLTFNIHHYTVKHQQEAKHQEDILDQNTTVLNVDGYVCATGTGSCGPATLDMYRVFTDKPLEFSFDILPIK